MGACTGLIWLKMGIMADSCENGNTIWVPQNDGNFLSSRRRISCFKTLLHGVICLVILLRENLGFEVFAEGKSRVTVMTTCSLVPTTPILMVRVLPTCHVTFVTIHYILDPFHDKLLLQHESV